VMTHTFITVLQEIKFDVTHCYRCFTKDEI